MSNLKLDNIVFIGRDKKSDVNLINGVNVICGASDTGKSYLAEAIDYMLGGSKLRPIPEADKYDRIMLEITSGEKSYIITRSINGGDFSLINSDNINEKVEPLILNATHEHGRTDNLSGFLLEKIGLLNKKILFSSSKLTTRSLSFRNIARLVIIQEEEIQTKGSPFWDGEFTLKTSELATIKLLLSGNDDSSIVAVSRSEQTPKYNIQYIDEIINEYKEEISNYEKEDNLIKQLQRITKTIDEQNVSLNNIEAEYNKLVIYRNSEKEEIDIYKNRIIEISEHLERFKLLNSNYQIDIDRLAAIKESGSMFLHLGSVPCPLCGALPTDQHLSKECDGNSEAIINAAEVEMLKIINLRNELLVTTKDLKNEMYNIKTELDSRTSNLDKVNNEIKQMYSNEVWEKREQYSKLVNIRANIQKKLEQYAILNKMIEKRVAIEKEEENYESKTKVTVGPPDSIMNSFSIKIGQILKAWNFPGDCRVYYDKTNSDFVIDGKHRGSRGKGLRAITHAAITIGLLEYCQENDLPHSGFTILDSPLLAYFKPEEDDNFILQGTNLKEKFYEYIIEHHNINSQIIIIENQHPQLEVQNRINMIVFTGNPTIGRYGLL